MVIYFPVVADPDGAIFIRHRLVAAGEVHDREPAMAQSSLRVYEQTGIIGPAMRKRVAHTNEQRLIYRTA